MPRSTFPFLATMALSFGAISCGGLQDDGDPVAAATEVAALVQSSEDALNERDFDAFFSTYSTDADLIAFDGPHAEGVQAAQDVMEQGWSTTPSDVSADLRLRTVRLVTPDVAIADVDGIFTGSDPSHDRATMVLSRGGEGWQVEAARILQPQVGIAAIRDGVASTWTAFERAWEAGDLDAILGLYTADAQNMPFFGQTQSGKAELEAFLAPQLANGSFDVTSQETLDVGGQGTIAYEIGVLEQTYTPTGGTPNPQRMRYMSVFHLEPDGVWRFHRWIAQWDE